MLKEKAKAPKCRPSVTKSTLVDGKVKCVLDLGMKWEPTFLTFKTLEPPEASEIRPKSDEVSESPIKKDTGESGPMALLKPRSGRIAYRVPPKERSAQTELVSKAEMKKIKAGLKKAMKNS